MRTTTNKEELSESRLKLLVFVVVVMLGMVFYAWLVLK